MHICEEIFIRSYYIEIMIDTCKNSKSDTRKCDTFRIVLYYKLMKMFEYILLKLIFLTILFIYLV